MSFVLCALILSGTYLLAQRQEHRHLLAVARASTHATALERRLAALETARTSQFDQAAFEELKTKVESLRVGQGIRVSR